MIGDMPSRDPQLDELRAVLDAALTGRATLAPNDVRRLISSWELMRRALADAPPPKLAIDSHEVPHTIWYRGERKQALDALAAGTVLDGIEAMPAGAASPEEIRRDHRSRVEAARALTRSWEAAHGPLPANGAQPARAAGGRPGRAPRGRR
jgi:hypothetical protein